MSSSDNAAKAIELLEGFRTGNRARLEELVHPEGRWWIIGIGYSPIHEMIDKVCQYAGILSGTPMTILSTTSEEDRVSIEGRGNNALPDGTPYCNDYHYLFRFKDGLIIEGKEYLDLVLVKTVFGDNV